MRCLSALTILLSLFVSTGWSQAPFFPFEENGPFGIDGVGPFGDIDPVVWFPTTGTFGGFTSDYSDNALTLSNAPLVPGTTNRTLGLTVVLAPGPNDSEGAPTFPAVIGADFAVEATVRLNSGGGFGSIWTRGQSPPPDGDGAAYVGAITGDGRLVIENFADIEGSLVQLQTDLDPINNDVILRVETIGNTVTARARLADPLGEWSDPLTASFESRPPGSWGLGFGFQPDGAPDPDFPSAEAVTRFRSVTATVVPEPSTASLIGAGLFGVFSFCRRRIVT